jgi:hypothetical protein
MPTLLAAVAASAAGWLSGRAIRSVAGLGASLLTSLVVSSIVFVIAKRLLGNLRAGR